MDWRDLKQKITIKKLLIGLILAPILLIAAYVTIFVVTLIIAVGCMCNPLDMGVYEYPQEWLKETNEINYEELKRHTGSTYFDMMLPQPILETPFVFSFDLDGDKKNETVELNKDITVSDESGKEVWRYGQWRHEFTSVDIVDLDGDKSKEVIIGAIEQPLDPMYLIRDYSNFVHVLNEGGELLYKLKLPTDATYGAGPEVKIVDLDNDGKLEIVANTAVYESDGKEKWSYNLPIFDWWPENNLIVEDLDGDGIKEIIVVSTRPVNFRSDALIIVFDKDGKIKWNFNYHDWIEAIAVDDLDGDGKKEIIVKKKVYGIVQVFGEKKEVQDNLKTNDTSISEPSVEVGSYLNGTLSIIGDPKLNNTVEVIFTFDAFNGTYNKVGPTTTAQIQLPNGLELISGDLNWEGALEAGDSRKLVATVKVTSTGNWTLKGIVVDRAETGPTSTGDADIIYLMVMETETTFAKYIPPWHTHTMQSIPTETVLKSADDPFGTAPKGVSPNCGPEELFKFDVSIDSKEDFVEFLKNSRINEWTQPENFKVDPNPYREVDWDEVLIAVKTTEIEDTEIYSLDYYPSLECSMWTLKMTNEGHVSVYGCCGF